MSDDDPHHRPPSEDARWRAIETGAAALYAAIELRDSGFSDGVYVVGFLNQALERLLRPDLVDQDLRYEQLDLRDFLARLGPKRIPEQ